MSTPDPVPSPATPAPAPPSPAQQLQSDMCDRLLATRRALTNEIADLQNAAALIADRQARVAAIDAQLSTWGVTPPAPGT